MKYKISSKFSNNFDVPLIKNSAIGSFEPSEESGTFDVTLLDNSGNEVQCTGLPCWDITYLQQKWYTKYPDKVPVAMVYQYGEADDEYTRRVRDVLQLLRVPTGYISRSRNDVAWFVRHFGLEADANFVLFEMMCLRYFFEFKPRFEDSIQDLASSESLFELFAKLNKIMDSNFELRSGHCPFYEICTPFKLMHFSLNGSHGESFWGRTSPTNIQHQIRIQNPELRKLDSRIRAGEVLTVELEDRYKELSVQELVNPDGFVPSPSGRGMLSVNLYTEDQMFNYGYDGEMHHGCFGGLVRADQYFDDFDPNSQTFKCMQVPVWEQLFTKYRTNLEDFLATDFAKKMLKYTDIDTIKKYGGIIDLDNCNGLVMTVAYYLTGRSMNYADFHHKIVKIDFEKRFLEAFEEEVREACIWEGDTEDAEDYELQEASLQSFSEINGYCWGVYNAIYES